MSAYGPLALPEFWRQSRCWFQRVVCCSISAAHWELIRTMTTSIQVKGDDRWRKCWNVWGELCQAQKMHPGKLWNYRGSECTPAVSCCSKLCAEPWKVRYLHEVVCCRHLQLGGLGQVQNHCLSQRANTRHTSIHIKVAQMCQINERFRYLTIANQLCSKHFIS